MANLEPLIQSIPVAPLKLASLEGCRTLADQVNNYLVSFRHESPTNVGQADSLQGYCADSYLLECECPRFGSVHTPADKNLHSNPADCQPVLH